MTGDYSAGTCLPQTDGTSPNAVAQHVRHVVRTGAEVSDIQALRFSSSNGSA
jgi:hypothetical protein